jgi:hypothetical protein
MPLYPPSLTHNAGVYLGNGGGRLHIGNPVAGNDGQVGAVVALGSEGTPVAYRCTITPAAGSANVCLVTIQFTDGAGNAMPVPINFDLTLSDAATGAGLTAVTASGAVAAGASGTDLGTFTSKKALHCQTDATGKYILSITDTSKTGFYVVVQAGLGNLIVSAQLVAGNYG